MKTKLCVTLFALAVPQLASATELRLYDPVDRSLVTKEAEAKVADMVRICARGALSRIGPSPAQLEQCRVAERKVEQLGPLGARAALAQLELPSMDGRYTLYEIIGRSGSTDLIEPLVKALEREAAAGMDNPRHYEVGNITRTLTSITYAAPKGTPAIQWRKWADAHRGMDRAALLRERRAEVETQVAASDVDIRIEAAAFLADQDDTHERGKQVLTEISARTDLSPEQRRHADDKLYWVATRNAHRAKSKTQVRPPLIVADPGS